MKLPSNNVKIRTIQKWKMTATSCLLHFCIVLRKIRTFLLNKKKWKKKLTIVRTLTFYDIKGAELPKILSQTHNFVHRQFFYTFWSNNQESTKKINNNALVWYVSLNYRSKYATFIINSNWEKKYSNWIY